MKMLFKCLILSMISLTVGLSSCSSDEFLPVEQPQEVLVLSKNLSSADALSVANHFTAQRFGVRTGMPSRSENAAQPIKNDNGETIAYVVNTNGAGYGLNLIVNPGTTGGVSYTRFHMNWGWGGAANGWYIDATPRRDDGSEVADYNTDRKNLYVSPAK